MRLGRHLYLYIIWRLLDCSYRIYFNITSSVCLYHTCFKFLCDVAPLQIETERYTRTPEEKRLCIVCNLQEVESEGHCLIRYELYADIRQTLFHTAFLINSDFDHFNDTNKLCFILSNEQLIPNIAKASHNILTKRSAIIYHSWNIDVLVIWHLNMYYKVTMWFYTAI